MTRGNNNTVHLGLQDWLVLASILLAIVIPSVALWAQVQRQVAEILVHQSYILDRLNELEEPMP
jgi:hypothetical protein